ncbi:translocation/assembly module TamB domain-containing protein [Phaeovulum sp.]|uniref:translocation/assembly module TamB domain-containing protein n=1 Tax=Phaeovulum sp. TaxID=2934796 RepID=UPI0035612D66
MRRLLLSLLLSLAALGTPAQAQTDAETERDRGFLQALLEDNLSGAGRDVRIEGFAGALSSRATFSELTIADDAGIWLRIQGGAIGWNRGALVSGRVEIAELAADEIELVRLPQSTAAPATPEAVPFALPELPVSVSITNLLAARVVLGAEVLGEAATMRVQGSLDLANGEGRAEFIAERIDDKVGKFSVLASFANATRELLLDLVLDEAAGGIVSNALGLPDSPALTLAIAGSGPIDTFSADIALDTDRKRRVSGRVALKMLDAETRGFSATLKGDIAPLLAPDYRGFFGSDVQLVAEGQRSGEGAINLQTLSLQAAAFSLEGSLDLQASGMPERANLELTLGLPDAAEVLLPLSGAQTWVANGALTLGYDRAKSETWSLAGNLNGLRQGQESISAIELTGSGRVAQGAASAISGAFDFAARGIAPTDPALASVLVDGLGGQIQFSWQKGGALVLPMLSLNAGGAMLSGSGEIGSVDDATRVSASARISHPDLSRFADLSGQALGGRLEGVVEGWYEPLQGDLYLETALLGIELRTGIAELDPLLQGGSRLRLVVDRDSAGLVLALDANARGFSIQSEALLQTEMTSASAHFEVADLGLVGRGILGGLAADAHLSGAPGARVLRFDATGEGLAYGSFRLDGESTLKGELVEGTNGFALGAIDLSNAQLTASLGDADPAGLRSLSARLADVAPLAPGFSGPATASGTVQMSDEGYRVTLDLTGPGGTQGQLAGLIANDASSVDLALTGRAEAALFDSMVRPRSLQGPLAFDLRLEGAPSLGALSGRISSTALALADPTFGLSMQGITLGAEIAGGRVDVLATGQIEGGSMRISGPISLTAPYATDLSLSLANVPLRDPQLFSTQIDGALNISGALTGGAVISGNVVLAETELRVPETSGALALPDIAHIGAPGAVMATLRRADADGNGDQAAQGVAYGLDITVSAPRRIFVRGRGLDAELGGSLQLRGTTADVLPIGRFELVRGRLDLLGKRFALTSGQVRLQGALSPWLQFVATSVQDDITALITLEGPADALELSLSSVPSLPEDEVLAQLLFARDISTLSPIQAAQMAQAVAQLTGSGGEGLLGRLRSMFGLDDLDLATDAEGDATLKVGKYLSDNIYTDISIGADGETSVNLNLDITPSLAARGSLAADGSSGLGIYFERDY